MAHRVSVAVHSADLLGEGPSWDEGRLSWVDIKARVVRSWTPGRLGVTSVAVPDEPSLALPRRSGGRVVTQVDRVTVAYRSGALSPLCEVDAGQPQTRLNDGCVDHEGRLWVCTYSTGSHPEAGLFVITADGVVRQVLDGMLASNGVGWSPDGEVLHVADTGRCRVDSFRLTAAGELRRCGTLLAEDGSRGRPDGLAVDRDGGVWVAMWGGGHLRRCTPDGRVSHEVPVPVTYATSVAFGGRDLRTLFVTTSRHHLADPGSQPDAGHVLSLRTQVAGLPTHRFAG